MKIVKLLPILLVLSACAVGPDASLIRVAPQIAVNENANSQVSISADTEARVDPDVNPVLTTSFLPW